jgi:superfamily I DNA/RNA helicase
MSIEEFATPMLREVYATYEEEKTQAHCFDFDDLILQVLTLFKKNDEFRAKFQQRVRHILVDEYQDTSHVQHQLLKYMGLDTSNKFAVDSLCAVAMKINQSTHGVELRSPTCSSRKRLCTGHHDQG